MTVFTAIAVFPIVVALVVVPLGLVVLHFFNRR